MWLMDCPISNAAVDFIFAPRPLNSSLTQRFPQEHNFSDCGAPGSLARQQGAIFKLLSVEIAQRTVIIALVVPHR